MNSNKEGERKEIKNIEKGEEKENEGKRQWRRKNVKRVTKL